MAPTAPTRRRWLAWALLLNAVVWWGAGGAAIWLPVWLHWRVTPAAVAAEVIEQHRRLPDDHVLAVVAETSMMTDHPLRGAAAAAAAQRLLRGELALPNLPVVPIDPGFARADLSQGVPVQHIFTASLIVPDLLLRAHEHAPDAAYVAAALRYVRGFIEFEASVQLPRDEERNSHAVANRASVLARLWRHVRQAPGYEPETGRLIHLHAQRLAALLSKPSTFIASTNHGVMQNIGLLQLVAAFPNLPDAAALRALAVKRLAMQLPGWIASDGAVLEHSAGYHFHGVVLSGYVVRLLQLLGEPVPPAWNTAHQQALVFLSTLQRPDRSLPQYGNTFRYAWQLPPVLGVDDGAWLQTLRDRASFERVFPVSGHAVWWSAESAAGVGTHTHLPWGYFADHGHRRAQELSLLIWAAGTDWSTNTGYWPGDDPSGIVLSDGWAGGNGPHMLGEAAGAERRSRLLAQGASADLRLLDVRREASTAAGAPLHIRRQVLQWKGSTWVVLDTHDDPQRRSLQVIWTSAPESTQRQVGGSSFVVEREGSPVAMTISIDGRPAVTATPRRGSREPFAGWVAFDRRAATAPSVDLRQPSEAGAWLLTTLDLSPLAGSKGNPFPWLRATMVAFTDHDHWTIRLVRGQPGEALLDLMRDGDVLRALPASPGDSKAAPSSLRLDPAPGAGPALAAIAASRAELLAAYPRFRTREWERARNTRLLAAGWLASSLGLAAAAWWLARRQGRRRAATVRD
jgi:hypothetical protein